MIPFNSRISKLIIFVKFNDSDEVEEVVILLMKGTMVLNVMILGQYIDDSPHNIDDLIQGIIDEETDSRFLDINRVEFNVRNIGGAHYPFIISEIYSTMEEFISDEECDYVVYNEYGTDDISEFFIELEDYIYDQDEELLPNHFSNIYSGDSDIDFILSKNSITGHSHINESSISNAIYTGVLFDISVGV